MSKIAISTPAPNIEMDDYLGRKIRLSNYRNLRNVILVFNRTFT